VKPEALAVLDRAHRAGAGDAEIFFASGDDFTVKVYEGRVESLESARSRGVGVRTLQEGRVGFAYGSDVSAEGLDRLLQEALRNGSHNQPDEANALPELQVAAPISGLFAAEVGEMDPELKVQLALQLEQKTIGIDPRVRRVESATYADSTDHIEIYNSRGLAAAVDRTTTYCVVLAIAEADGEMQQGYAFAFGRRSSELDIDRVAQEAAARAAGLLGGRPVATARMPVVLDPLMAVSILGVLASTFSAEAVQKGRSLLAGRVGQAIAAPVVSVVDDGRAKAGLACRPLDGEGVPTQRTQVVKDGVLCGYLHNTYTARKGEARSTGNAVRSYRSQPTVGPTNLLLEPGTAPREALLREGEGGIYVTELAGLHTVNPMSGEFSLGAKGHRITAASLGAPVRDVTIAGNLLDLLQKVRMVGNDLRWVFQVASPTILIEDLAVGGA